MQHQPTNDLVEKEPKQPEENNTNQNYDEISENEKIRKASCDISLFESENNKEKESQQARANEDSSFTRNNFENSRDNRIILPENDEFNRVPCERIKKSFSTKKYK